MDFASLMKFQISAAAPKQEGGKKYLKRSEVEAQREAQYRKEQEEAERAREEKLRQKRKRDEEEAEASAVREEKKRRLAEESRRVTEKLEEQEERERRKRLGLPELPPKGDGESADGTSLGESEQDIAEENLLAKLRELGEPRRLFGESHVQRLKRYRKLTAPVVKMTRGPIPTSIELLEEKDMKVPMVLPEEEDKDGRQYLYRQLASYFDMVLTEWAAALTRRPQEVKDSVSGKQAAQSYIAARDSLKPLFKQLENGSIETDILAAVNEIVDLAQQKRYVHANDAYLRLSIGKAAWPIGVTMVGIHERSAREKLHETGKNAAHILADETTRKMLQGIKRCLSFAQTRWPPEDHGQLMG
ncbi:Prp18-domain-containing protein [Polychaeton citri CBS 116435]|uniref:Pre-mRNA-splicing factor 18 n=1 Tax=Polychaeton citri CBS 116435 TaxID=1314669 RepID=A0A9P4Q0N1_9PEZI|nr:Prp18-domain-containing protein [Polychaeton citri CBS 116435]